MTSEIRANVIKNRVGLGTIEYSNTGPIISGVTTALNFKTGTSNLHNTGLNVQDLDVDGHTNLDNVSVAGITTFSGILDAVNTPASIRVAQDIQHKGDANTKITFPANDNISFDTAGSERLRIAYNGTIGINSTSPGALLDLSSSQPGILFSETGVSANNGKWLNQANASELYWQAQTDAHSGGGNLFKMTRSNEQIQTFEAQQSGVSWFTIRNSDKTVGIGTNNPQCILDINKDIAGGVNYVDIRNHHATGGAALRVKSQGSYGSPFYQGILGASDLGGTIRVGAVSNHPLVFIINNQEKVRIDTTGRIQVGSTNDTSKNQFNGPGLLNLQNNNADGTVDYTQGIVFTNNQSNEGTWTQAAIVTTGSSGYNGNLIFATDGSGARDNAVSNFTERLRITSAGLVQIGLTGMTGGNDQALVVNNPANNANVLELSTSNSAGRINCSRTLSNTLNTTSYIEWTEPGAQGTGDLRFGTSASSNNPQERLRIDEEGRLQIGSSISTGNNQFNGPGRLNINNNSADGTVDFSQGIIFTDNTNNQGTWTHAGIVCTGSTGYNGNLIFGTDGSGARDNSASNITERMRINSDGDLMVGTTSDVSNVKAIFGKNHNNITAISVENTDTNNAARIRYEFKNGSNTSYIEKYNTGGWYFFNGTPSSSNPNVGFYGSSSWISLRLRPGDRSGNDVAHIAAYWGTSNGLMIEQGGPQSGTFKAIRFTTSHYGGERGYIGVTLGGTSYNSSSDYRMKQDVIDLTGAIDRVKSFKPKRFKWKEDPTYTVDGFLAHEASTVVPESVVGEKDAVDSNGDPEYQVMDNSKLVPVLTAALKEAIAKIEILETKVAALEG